ncbi:aldolase/citrate lyase family protein [Kiloniella laminariae]|uniref:Aldolase/citrate lyase family protein n=1 Tax=Kiloniella laminariae TaxID=454162 RepID=A0ABT4LG86_9PROT|nr:aldolase/citrate lyase family protein [Kiloniella laminariae]MCZ4280104.1 aldolase/citrate lyase family protein [Kiloniella laminariae]
MTKEFLLRKLGKNHPAFGCWIDMFSPLATEIIAQAGNDCLMIDLEHGPGSIMDALTQMQAARAYGPKVYVRVSSNASSKIKRVLDAGADGVMIPSVSSAEEARKAVEAALYAPLGNRGVASTIIRAADYGVKAAEYLESFNDQVMVICQIETAEGAKNAQEIVTTAGVDTIFIGPADLSSDLGYPGQPDHPEVMKVITEIEKIVLREGKILAGLPSAGRSAADLYKARYDIVFDGADIGFVVKGAQAKASELRKILGRK